MCKYKCQTLEMTLVGVADDWWVWQMIGGCGR